MTKTRKLTRAQEYRLKELENQQKAHERDASLAIDRVHAEAAEFRSTGMRAITDKVSPVEVEYRRACKRLAEERDKLVRELRKSADKAMAVARMHKREALASLEKEIDNLNEEVKQRIASGIAVVDAELEGKLRVLAEERQAIQGGNEPKVQELPDKPDVPGSGAEASDRKPVGVQTV